MFASICWQPDLCDWDAEAHNLRITSSTRTTLPLNQPLRRACCTRVLSMIATLSILRARYVGQNGDLQLSKLTNHTSFHPDFVPVSCICSTLSSHWHILPSYLMECHSQFTFHLWLVTIGRIFTHQLTIRHRDTRLRTRLLYHLQELLQHDPSRARQNRGLLWGHQDSVCHCRVQEWFDDAVSDLLYF